MAVTVSQETKTAGAIPAWQGFRTGLWQKEINVRDFIQQNYEPYEGDDAFLAPATRRGRAAGECSRRADVCGISGGGPEGLLKYWKLDNSQLPKHSQTRETFGDIDRFL
jgi:hypothetical protein